MNRPTNTKPIIVAVPRCVPDAAQGNSTVSEYLLLSVFVGLLLVCPVKGAEEPPVLPVWPGAVPGDYGSMGPERVRGPSEAPTKNAKWITNVTKPTITIFRPAK